MRGHSGKNISRRMWRKMAGDMCRRLRRNLSGATNSSLFTLSYDVVAARCRRYLEWREILLDHARKCGERLWRVNAKKFSMGGQIARCDEKLTFKTFYNLTALPFFFLRRSPPFLYLAYHVSHISYLLLFCPFLSRESPCSLLFPVVVVLCHFILPLVLCYFVDRCFSFNFPIYVY